MSHAVAPGLIAQNPLRDIKNIKRAKDTPNLNRYRALYERRNVIKRAPAHLKLPIMLSMFYGLRQGDVLRLPRWPTVPVEITLTTRKRQVPVSLPIFSEIRAAITEHDETLAARQAKPKPRKGNADKTVLEFAGRRLDRIRLQRVVSKISEGFGEGTSHRSGLHLSRSPSQRSHRSGGSRR
jgi:hypothetical protein